MSNYPAEIRDVRNINDYKAELGAGSAVVDTVASGVHVRTITKEFATVEEIELARKRLEEGKYVIVPGVSPITWVGTLLRYADMKEVVKLEKI